MIARSRIECADRFLCEAPIIYAVVSHQQLFSIALCALSHFGAIVNYFLLLCVQYVCRAARVISFIR